MNTSFQNLTTAAQQGGLAASRARSRDVDAILAAEESREVSARLARHEAARQFTLGLIAKRDGRAAPFNFLAAHPILVRFGLLFFALSFAFYYLVLHCDALLPFTAGFRHTIENMTW